MVLWEEDSFGTVQLRDLYQGVGSTDTIASRQNICKCHAQWSCCAVGGRVETEDGWWCRFSRQLDTRGSSCPLKGHLLYRPVTGR